MGASARESRAWGRDATPEDDPTKWALTVDQATALATQLPWLLRGRWWGSRCSRGFGVASCSRCGGGTSMSRIAACRCAPPSTKGCSTIRRRWPVCGPSLCPMLRCNCWRRGRRGRERTAAHELIFSTVSGKPISPNNVLRRWVWPACQAADLKRATWLTFRRTYSSWAHDKGVPAKVVAQIMGHTKVDTTMNVYTQVLDGAARVAADRVGSELFRIVQIPDGTTTPTH